MLIILKILLIFAILMVVCGRPPPQIIPSDLAINMLKILDIYLFVLEVSLLFLP